VEYVRRLQTQQESLFAMLDKNKQLEQHNQQLRREVQVSALCSNKYECTIDQELADCAA